MRNVHKEKNIFKNINDYEMTPRISHMKEKVLNTQPEICIERAKVYTEVYKEYEDEPLYLKRAHALKRTLKEMSIYIGEMELIVGNLAFKDRAAPIFPEYSIQWVIDEIDKFDKRPGDRFIINNTKKKDLLVICEYWKNKTVHKKALKIMPPEIRKYYDLGILKAEGNITSGTGHLAVDYETVIKKGLKFIREQIEQKLKEIDETEYENVPKRLFYTASLIVIDACVEFAKRFSILASEMAVKENNEQRKKELLKISEICAKVPENPADTFYEALQSIWFIQLILQIESNGHSISLGRLDQYLYNNFKRDIDTGTIDYDGVLELLQCLWIKLFSINKLRPWSHTRFSPGSPLYQNVTIAGQTRDGKDATNDLTRLILRSVGIIRLTQPLLTPRLHKNTPEYFLKEIIDVINLGFGMPALINDEAIVDGMINIGISKEEALDYTIVGCIEPALQGRWGYRPTGMSFVNLMKILNLTLNSGKMISNDEQVYQNERNSLMNFENFDDLMSELEKQIKYFTKCQVVLDSVADFTLENNVPDVLASCLVKDCIEKGKNLFEGGAKYDWISGMLVGNANIANALAAIKYLIFENNLVKKKQLMNALKNNFGDKEGDFVRSLIVNKPPKYGNDDDYVDLLLKRVFEIHIEEIFKHKNIRCGRGPISCGYYAGTSSLTANVAMGSQTEATPDGRKAGEPLAEGVSPMHGTDITGPTAVLKTVAKLPTKYILGGVLLNQKFNPSYLSNQFGINKFGSLIKTFFNDLKGFHIQYNIVSAERLRDAQKHPEKYKDLIVRVAGYSALFIQVSPEIQEDIIARTEFKL